MSNLVSRLLPACLLSSVLLLAVALTGCGASSTPLGSGAQPSLTPSPPVAVHASPTARVGILPKSTASLACELQVTARPIDTIGETLHCTVSHLPSGQTKFVLIYSIKTNAGNSIVLLPACQGNLSGGAGSCTVIISSPLPQATTRGVVSGWTQPGQYPLGPITPKQVAGGIPPGTPLPFQPRG
jgi:hypothetical protein